MADDKQKPLTIIALILVLGIGAILLMNLGKECPDVDCPDCEKRVCPTDKGEIDFLYLYPPGCEGCDVSAVADMFGDLNLEVGIYQNDGVPFPHLVVMKEDGDRGNISTMVSALNRYNVLQFLCLTKHESACYLSDGYLNQMQSCLADINISMDTVAFHYSESCKSCNKSYWMVDEIEDEGHNFLWLKEDSTNWDVKDQMQCMDGLLNIPEGVPQYICVSTGEIYTDTSKESYKAGDIRSFVRRCEDGAGD
ncbi:MAG: hypothetical protein KKH78_02700 [Candidatus Altiarchaeota archaeon]|nr:hypothetical protein [Candidatus Altiarchaeota archaeon]MBU4437164.1 hypothetical protein [Candidatus Altiarchaeota archaeon]